MSKRGIEELVEDFFDVPSSLGSISNLEQATSEAVAAPVEEVARVILEGFRTTTKRRTPSVERWSCSPTRCSTPGIACAMAP
ncbi:hypothetical protein [Sorangium cellulosum]|uniref:hypothetical protein n=1 Tax=Sorangium cellulosum TaxID=56 RepID=UPI00133174D5|nr:hypothetical protein [Sorangium cellulosum]